MTTDPFENSEEEYEENYRENLEEALRKAREIGDADEEARVLLNLGEYYGQKLEYEEAAECIERGLDHLKTTSQYALSISPLFQLARIYRVLNRNDRSFALYNQVIDYAEMIDNRCALGYAMASKGTILVEEGSHRNGLEFIFRGFHLLEELKLPERLEVKEWILDCRRSMPRATYDLAIHQSAVSPKTKTILKQIE